MRGSVKQLSLPLPHPSSPANSTPGRDVNSSIKGSLVSGVSFPLPRTWSYRDRRGDLSEGSCLPCHGDKGVPCSACRPLQEQGRVEEAGIWAWLCGADF